MYTNSFKRLMVVCGATALIMGAALPTAAFATGPTSDQQIARNVRDTLDQSVNSVAAKIDQGHVYLTGQFNTPEARADAVGLIDGIPGVRGVYDYTEDLSGSNGD